MLTVLTDPPDPAAAPALRWGILAPGGIAHRFAREVGAHTRSVIAAVGSRDLGRARRFADQYGIARAHGSYEDLVADPDIDAVYIASPHSEHHDHAVLALTAGKPVLVEKAFTLNEAQAAAVFALARQKQLFVMEAMWSRFLPHYARLRQLVADGRLGELRHVTAIHAQSLSLDPLGRFMNPAVGGGALLDLGVYPLACCHMLLGVPDSLVTLGVVAPTGVDRAETIALRWGDTLGTAVADCAGAGLSSLAVVGTAGRVDVPDWFYTPQDLVFTPRGGEPTVLPTRVEGGFQFEAAEAARQIAAGALESPWMTWQDTLDVMRTMDEVRRQLGVRYPQEAAAGD